MHPLVRLRSGVGFCGKGAGLGGQGLLGVHGDSAEEGVGEGLGGVLDARDDADRRRDPLALVRTRSLTCP